MQIIEPLEFGKYYHIYNRGINSENLFKESRNYEYFLTLHTKHIEPIAETFAWCLLKNHFHLLVRVKTFEEILVSHEEHESKKLFRLINPLAICLMHIQKQSIKATTVTELFSKDLLKEN